MRKLPNETPGLNGKDEHVPERKCILTGTHGPRSGLIRLALDPDGNVLPDIKARAPGRGAWIGVDRPTLETAIAKGKLKGALARAFKTQAIAIPEDLPQRIGVALGAAWVARLGFWRLRGTFWTGPTRSPRQHAKAWFRC